MKSHFKKASIFEISKTRALHENNTVFHLLNGPKTKNLIEDNKSDNKDNIALLKHIKNVNRWKEHNHILDKADIRPILKPEKNLHDSCLNNFLKRLYAESFPWSVLLFLLISSSQTLLYARWIPSFNFRHVHIKAIMTWPSRGSNT
jgi:hypothetical protein